MRSDPPLIVVVDPNSLSRELMRDVFTRRFDAHVVTLEAASALPDALNEALPDLIVYELHRAQGPELAILRRVKADKVTQPIPVLGLIVPGAGFGCDSIADVGCDGCLTKPLRLPELVATAGRMLGAGGQPRQRSSRGEPSPVAV